MKLIHTLHIIAGLSFCAFAPLIRAQCPQACNGQNTALGDSALPIAASSAQDTAIGFEASLQANGARNTALGYHAGNSITTATDDTTIGNEAGATSSVGLLGSFSTAVGSEALNSSGDNNTAVGYRAIFTGSVGAGNTALGANAMVGDFNSDTIRRMARRH
jgi:trimeric autotransporter adhesin